MMSDSAENRADLRVDDGQTAAATPPVMYDGVEILDSSGDERAERGADESGAPSLSVAGAIGSTHATHVARIRAVRRHQTHLYIDNAAALCGPGGCAGTARLCS